MYKVVEKALSIIKRWRILRGRVDILLVFKKYCVPPNGHVMLYLNINTSEIPNHFTLLFFAEKANHIVAVAMEIVSCVKISCFYLPGISLLVI